MQQIHDLHAIVFGGEKPKPRVRRHPAMTTGLAQKVLDRIRAGKVEAFKRIAQSLHLVRTSHGYYLVSDSPAKLPAGERSYGEVYVPYLSDLTVGDIKRIRFRDSSGKFLPADRCYVKEAGYYFSIYRVTMPFEDVARYVEGRRGPSAR